MPYGGVMQDCLSVGIIMRQIQKEKECLPGGFCKRDYRVRAALGFSWKKFFMDKWFVRSRYNLLSKKQIKALPLL